MCKISMVALCNKTKCDVRKWAECQQICADMETCLYFPPQAEKKYSDHFLEYKRLQRLQQHKTSYSMTVECYHHTNCWQCTASDPSLWIIFLLISCSHTGFYILISWTIWNSIPLRIFTSQQGISCARVGGLILMVDYILLRMWHLHLVSCIQHPGSCHLHICHSFVQWLCVTIRGGEGSIPKNQY